MTFSETIPLSTRLGFCSIALFWPLAVYGMLGSYLCTRLACPVKLVKRRLDLAVDPAFFAGI